MECIEVNPRLVQAETEAQAENEDEEEKKREKAEEELSAAAAEARRAAMRQESIRECSLDGRYLFVGLFFAESEGLQRDWFAEDALLRWRGWCLPFRDFRLYFVH